MAHISGGCFGAVTTPIISNQSVPDLFIFVNDGSFSRLMDWMRALQARDNVGQVEEILGVIGGS